MLPIVTNDINDDDVLTRPNPKPKSKGSAVF